MSRGRDIRVLPLVLAAITGFAVLKVSALVLEGRYVFSAADARPLSWAQKNLNFPSSGREVEVRDIEVSDITGSVAAPPVVEKAATSAPVDSANIANMPSDQAVSPTERAVLERLQERRREIEARAREVDIRENLLSAAEKRIELRTEEMKGIESRIVAAKDQKAEDDVERFKSIVTMYEGMKPKDAARIFSRLDMPVLIEVASKIAPRKMADILGLMQADAAQRLTVELARRAGADKVTSIADLPKIEGIQFQGKPVH